MRVDRRDFLKISGAGALTAAAAGCNWGQNPSDNKQPNGRTSTGGTLRMEFSGLVLLERQAGDTLIHLVDGNAISLALTFRRCPLRLMPWTSRRRRSLKAPARFASARRNSGVGK